ncbi:Vps51/Vps67 family protein [Babesia bovis T2Bo]|uniref:Vacuolar protein sorting-associated protein 51 homolog n=1 Tax=Babesia bovis TaxID=5865 RepID=A7AVE9_BABBO|nr:Vps51/Vps67 family protein [Babesia bovis T2Bo]EDO05775.1 Vps51/Vps67 family protein [Babesia bovis T2Bo]|eukprot:XP_001609343.1 hypothetical protein [Babesia bovis T2Bo]
MENETSVSALLSAYYDIGAPNEETATSSQNSANNAAKGIVEEDFLSDAAFGNADCNIDTCLNSALKKYSLNELNGLLRRLEREVRQYTAGKQILIYDNYECLFTALDTVHEINCDLNVVQKRLQALKSSQIKASTIDVSSKYGFRQKLRGITEINRILNIFKALSCIVTSLKHESQPPLDKDIMQYLTVKTETIAKVYSILKAITSRVGSKISRLNLFNTIGKVNVRLIIQVVEETYKAVKRECFTNDSLLKICNNLATVGLNITQVWELYWSNKSFSTSKHITSLYSKAIDANASIHSLSSELEICLDHILEAVNSDGYHLLAKHKEDYDGVIANVDIATYQPPSITCLFCCDDGCDLTIVGDIPMWTDSSTKDTEAHKSIGHVDSNFYIKTTSEMDCSCQKGHISQQYVTIYVQLAFAAFKGRIIGKNAKLSCKEVVYLLNNALEMVKGIPQDNECLIRVKNISFGWILSIVLLYVQKSFHPMYDALASTLMYNAEKLKQKGAFSEIHCMVEDLLKDELTYLIRFVDDLENVMQTELKPFFMSHVAYCILCLKKVFSIGANVLISLYEEHNDCDGCMDSILQMLALRSHTEFSRDNFINNHNPKSNRDVQTNENDAFNLVGGPDDDADFDSIRKSISLEYYLMKVLKAKLANLLTRGNSLRNQLTLIVSIVLGFNTTFDRITTVVESRLGSSVSSVIKSGNVVSKVSLPSEFYFSFKLEIEKSSYLGNLMDGFEETPYVDALLKEASVHLSAISHEIYKFNKLQTTKGLFPLIFKDGDALAKKCKLISTNTSVSFSTPQSVLRILVYVMKSCIKDANMLVSCAMDVLETRSSVDDGILNSFMGLLYELIEFLNVVADPALSTETSYSHVAEVNRKLKNIVVKNDIGVLCILNDLSFVPTKDICLKMFAIHIAQNISKVRKMHVLNTEIFKQFVSRIEKQLLMGFKNSGDAKQMRHAFDQIIGTAVL